MLYIGSTLICKIMKNDLVCMYRSSAVTILTILFLTRDNNIPSYNMYSHATTQICGCFSRSPYVSMRLDECYFKNSLISNTSYSPAVLTLPQHKQLTSPYSDQNKQMHSSRIVGEIPHCLKKN